VPALDEQVRADDDPAVRGPHDRGVVTRSEQDAFALRKPRGDACDEAELARVGNRDVALLRRRIRSTLPAAMWGARDTRPDP
jgi:hypothetical protein